MRTLNNTDVVILAGGLGTRLRELFPDVPKCLVPISGRPFLFYMLDWLAAYGARRVILALGFKADQVLATLSAQNRQRWPNMVIEHCIEPQPLGTGGALRLAASLLKTDETLALNGDSLTVAPLDRFLKFHRTHQARFSLLLTYQQEVAASGLVATDAHGRVERFEEKSAGGAGDINAGIYALSPSVLDAIAADTYVSLEREIFPKLVSHGLYAWRGIFPFLDIGTPQNYAKAAEFLSQISFS